MSWSWRSTRDEGTWAWTWGGGAKDSKAWRRSEKKASDGGSGTARNSPGREAQCGVKHHLCCGEADPLLGGGPEPTHRARGYSSRNDETFRPSRWTQGGRQWSDGGRSQGLHKGASKGPKTNWGPQSEVKWAGTPKSHNRPWGPTSLTFNLGSEARDFTWSHNSLADGRIVKSRFAMGTGGDGGGRLRQLATGLGDKTVSLPEQT